MSLHAPHTPIPYRKDIDGLRAIAVLAVILFHVDKQLIPGGFVGVDIFFVISGYLISRSILQDVEAGCFSLAQFYRSRIKRIAPPMLVMVFFTIVAAQLVFVPEDAERAAESGLWSVFSAANIYFWRHLDTSYFAPASNEAPLLHLWSLGVEEQFYFIWPLLLMAVYRRQRALAFLGCAAAAALASFTLAQFGYGSDPAFTYYMLPTRAGELLLGAMVAVFMQRRAYRPFARPASLAMAWAGALLLAASLGFTSEGQVFPGWLAVPPTLGTALLIAAGHCRDHLPIPCSAPVRWAGSGWCRMSPTCGTRHCWPSTATATRT